MSAALAMDGSNVKGRAVRRFENARRDMMGKASEGTFGWEWRMDKRIFPRFAGHACLTGKRADG